VGAFEYQAIDVRGRTRRGISSGDSARQVRQELREQGLYALSVTGVGESTTVSSTGRTQRARLKTGELAIITRQFATLLESGLTVEESLTALIQQAQGHRVKTVLSGVRSSVLEGKSLADAVAAYPRSFSEIFRATVAAGEQSGNLDTVLSRLADHVETRQSVQQSIGTALVYPVILTSLSVIIVIGLLTYVVPKVVRVFQDVGQSLPFLTRALIATSDFLLKYGLWLLAAMALTFVAGTYLLRNPELKFSLHRLWLRLPLISSLARTTNSTRMARTLAIMVGSGVPLLSAMRSCEGVMTNLVLQQDMRDAAEEVAEGVSVSRALGRSGRFPVLLVQMVASGEASGRLGAMLDKAANVMERELEGRVAVLLGLFQPAMILLMGVVVLIIVLAILLPIFDLNQLIR